MDSSTGNSPKAVKEVKKGIMVEDKDEELRVQQAIKDISLTTKSQQKAHKAALKADSTVSKLGKKESAAVAAVKKATYEHELAVTNLHKAESEAELKRREDAKLLQELNDKKKNLDLQMEEQKAHKRVRETKLQNLESNNGGIATRATDANAGGMNTTGSVPGQYGTGPQAPGTRGSGPGYADHNASGAMATGAGLVGGVGLATAAHGTRRDDTSGPEQGINQERIRDGDGNFGHRTDTGVGGIGHTGGTGPRSGIGSSAQQSDHGIRSEGIFAGYSGRHTDGANTDIHGQGSNVGELTGGGYGGGGGENLGFRGERMAGGSGTGADPGIRSGGARDMGGRSGDYEFVGDRNIVGGQGDIGYNVDRIGGQKNVHRGTGIGGRQGVGEDPDFSRDRNYMGGGERLGSGMGATSDIDGRARGPIGGGSQGYGEDTMPGGYESGVGIGATGGIGSSSGRY
ncbi:hypothetical protein H0H87_004228 [Tephrocybe sp. NHM501043]|nr:hypothetical protein H0H87_004228 [Tephrocybe sp. NHM501043]